MMDVPKQDGGWEYSNVMGRGRTIRFSSAVCQNSGLARFRLASLETRQRSVL